MGTMQASESDINFSKVNYDTHLHNTQGHLIKVLHNYTHLITNKAEGHWVQKPLVAKYGLSLCGHIHTKLWYFKDSSLQIGLQLMYRKAAAKNRQQY